MTISATENPSATRFARIMAHMTLAGAIALPCIAAVIWLFWDDLAPLAAGNLGAGFDIENLSPLSRLAGFAVALAGAGIQVVGLLGLRRTFQEGAAGRPLSARSVLGFRRFARVAVIMVFVGIVQNTAYIVIFSISDPSTQGQLSINFGSDEIRALFMALLLLFVARVFAAGKRAADENAAFL